MSVPVRLISLDGKDHVAMCHDASADGLLAGTPHRFRLGEEIHVSDVGSRRTVKGKIVRLERNAEAETILWRFRVAVTFAEPCEDLFHA